MLATLQRYDWPGNVRELRNLIERAIVMSPDGVLRLPEPLVVRPAVSAVDEGATELGRASLAELVQRYKARLIRTALARSGGNQRRAAEILGIHRPSLTRMLRDLEPARGTGSLGR
jgi:two-component system response regulator AtoC